MRTENAPTRSPHVARRLSLRVRLAILLCLSAVAWTGCARVVDLDGSPNGPWDPTTGRPGTASTVSVVIDEQETAVRIAVDATRIYWVSILQDGFRARVRSCRKDDCASTMMTYDESQLDFVVLPGATPPPTNNFFLTVAGNRVYWTRPAIVGVTILSCASEGCDGAPTIVEDKVPLTGMVADETHLYWTSSQDTAIYRRPLTGTAPVESIALNQSGLTEVRVDATHAYWFCTEEVTDGAGGRGGAGGADGRGTIRRVAKQGGRPENLATGLAWTSPHPLAIDSQSVVWGTSQPPGSISRCPLPGCSDAPTLILGDAEQPSSILSDGSSVFWIGFASGLQEEGRGKVMRCPVDDCAARKQTLASVYFYYDPRDNTSMVADEANVYWVAQGLPDEQRGAFVYPHSTIYRHPK